MADKLEKETKANEDAAKRIEELTAQVNELNNKVPVSILCKLDKGLIFGHTSFISHL